MGKNLDLLELKESLKKGEKLTDAQVVQLAKLRHQANEGRRTLRVGKLALREGEELMDFVWTMMDAVHTNRIVLADGSLDAWLQGIFEDHVVVQDGNTGRFFRADFSRDADGEFNFSEPVEVRMEWIPVAGSVNKRAPQEDRIVEICKADDRKWSGVLPNSFKQRR